MLNVTQFLRDDLGILALRHTIPEIQDSLRDLIGGKLESAQNAHDKLLDILGADHFNTMAVGVDHSRETSSLH